MADYERGCGGNCTCSETQKPTIGYAYVDSKADKLLTIEKKLDKVLVLLHKLLAKKSL